MVFAICAVLQVFAFSDLFLPESRVGDFIELNFAGPVTIACQGRLLACKHLYHLLASDRNVPTGLKTLSLDVTLETEKDFAVFVLSSPEDTSELIHVFRLIGDTKAERSLLYVVKELSDDDWTKVKETLSNLRQNSNFFLAFRHGSNVSFYRIITLIHQSHVVVNEVEFVDDSLLVKEAYNLLGMRIASISYPWPPYVPCSDYHAVTNDCKSISGALVDLIDNLASMINFTFISHIRQDGNWGVIPQASSRNGTRAWDGIIGDVVTKEYPMSLNVYVRFVDRDEVLDFVPIKRTHSILGFVPRPRNLDLKLFFRPFTTQAWMTIVGIVIIIGIVMTLPRLMLSTFRPLKETLGFTIASVTSWYFFVLLNAFYGGALTMFFITEETGPFDTVNDAIRAYPDWKLLIREGAVRTYNIYTVQFLYYRLTEHAISYHVHLVQERRQLSLRKLGRETQTL